MRKIRDPLKVPYRLPRDFASFDPRDLDRAAARVFPGYPKETHVLMASPGDWTPHIHGSELSGKCGKCGCAVWLSPSSLTTRPWPLIACIRCVVRELPLGHPLTGWLNAPPGGELP